MASAGKRIRRAIESVGFRVLVGGVRSLPRPHAQRLGAAVGRFAFDQLGVRRDVAIANVSARLVPPTAEAAREIARESYQVMGRTFADLLRADLLDDAEVSRLVDPRSFDDLVAMHKQGQGGLLVSAHFGNWELMVIAIRRLGLPVAAMAGDQANEMVDGAVRRIRERAGITPLSSRSGLRDALRIVRAGGFVATLMDQDARKKGIFVDFLGAPASTHVGVFSLAQRIGAPVVAGALVEEDGRHQLHVGPIWRHDANQTEEENLRRGAVEFNRWLEAEIRRYPGSYFWAHRRWKTKPPSGASVPSEPGSAGP